MRLWRRILNRKDTSLCDDRGWFPRFLSLYVAGDYFGADSLARETLAKLNLAVSFDPIELSTCLNLVTLAMSNSAESKSAEYRNLLRRAIEIDSSLDGPNHPIVAMHLRRLAESHMAVGEPNGARKALERTVGIQERIGGLSHPDLIPDLKALVVVLKAEGTPEDIVSVSKLILSIQESASGSTSNEFAIMLARLAYTLRNVPGIDMQLIRSWYAQAITILAEKPTDQLPAELADSIAAKTSQTK